MLDRIDVKYFKLAVGTEHIGKENNNDIAVRCPICGDSYKKKILNVYIYIKREM